MLFICPYACIEFVISFHCISFRWKYIFIQTNNRPNEWVLSEFESNLIAQLLISPSNCIPRIVSIRNFTAQLKTWYTYYSLNADLQISLTQIHRSIVQFWQIIQLAAGGVWETCGAGNFILFFFRLFTPVTPRVCALNHFK